ncbi:beta strand repeat-containing protein, partial [Nanoarchaeota archaeon]
SGASGAYTFTKTFTDGVYAWNCYACDDAGTCAFNSANRTFTVDLTNPTYTNFASSASAINTTDTVYISATWTDANPDTAILYVNGTANATDDSFTSAVNFSWTAPASAAEKDFVFSIWVNDSVGRSNQTTNTTVSVLDTTGPTVVLNSPANDSITNNSTITFQFTPTDNLGSVDNCTLLIDEVENETITSGITSGALTSFTPIAFADGDYNWSVDCSDGSGNVEEADEYFFMVDTQAPAYFSPSYSPANNTPYVQGATYYFNITVNDTADEMDTVWIQFNGVNYSTGNTGEVYLFNVTDLGFGTYSYVWFANDSAGNMDNTPTYSYGVARATSTCSVVFDPATPATYNDAVNASCSCTSPEASETLWREGASITSENNVDTIIGAGTYNYSCQAAQTQNYTSAQNDSSYTVNQGTPLLYIISSPSWSETYETYTNISCTANTAQVTPTLYRDGTAVSASGDYQQLGVATYNYTCNNTATQNYSSTINTTDLVITQAADAVNMTLNGAANQNISVVYPDTVTAVGYSTSGSDTVWRNGTLVNQSVAEQLAVGWWAYTVNSTGNTNYTTNGTGLTYWAQVNKTASAVNLVLNGQDSNITVNIGDSVSINASLTTGTGSIYLYEDSSLINSGASPISNLTSYSSTGTHNITIIYNETANYSTSSETHFITVQDVTAPNVTLTSPTDDTWSTSASVTFVYYVNDTSSGIQNCSLYVDSALKLTNSSVTEGSNQFAYSPGAGSHTWYVRCYDNSSNNNAASSSSRTIKVDTQSPSTTLLGVTNTSSYTSNVSLTFSASDNGDSGVNYTSYRIDAGAWQNYSTAINYGTEGTHSVLYYSVDTAGNVEATINTTFTIDTTGPTLSITAPAADANVSGTIAFSVTSAAANHTVFQINGTNLTDDSTTPFSYQLNTALYTDGVYTLNAIAYDTLGNSNSTSITVTIDNSAPASTITYPTTGFLTNAAVNVNGTVSDSGAGVDYVEVYDGTEWENATVTGGSIWNYTVYYASGTYNIKSRAVDDLGNTETPSAGINIVFDSTGPTITSISMDPNPAANATTVSVSADVSDTNGVTQVNATLDGTTITLSGSGNTYTGQFTSPAAENVYNVTIVALDNASNSATDSSYQLTVNATAPIISITPADSSVFTSGSAINISVSNADSSYYNTSVNATPTYFATSTSFSASGADGSYTVFVWANASSGAESTQTNTYTIDSTAPVVAINAVTSPTSSATQNVSGGVTETNLDYVNVNAALANLVGNNYWKVVSLSEGNNTITVAAYDETGTADTEVTYIFLDSNTPSTNHSLSGTSGDNGWYTSNVDVTLTASDGAQSSGITTAYCTGAACTPGTSYSSAVTISSEAATTFRYLTYDNAGNNESVNSVSISIDKTAPVVSNVNISTTTPAANESLTITATITDTNALAAANQQQVLIDGSYYAMSLVSGSTYKYDFTPTQAQNYTATVYGKDIAGNTHSSSYSFTTSIRKTETGYSFQNDSDNERDYTSEVDTILQINVNTSVVGDINVSEYSDEPTFVVASLDNAVKYVDIDLSANVMAVLEWIMVKIYYTDADISGIDESTLTIKWYNETTDTWITLSAGSPSWVYAVGVDTTNNYIWANVSHLSLFAFSGTTTSTTPPSGGGGGGGGSSDTPTAIDAGDLTGTSSEWTLTRGSTIQFTHDGTVNTLKVVTAGGNYATLTINDQTNTYLAGLSVDVDLDGDGKDDFIVKLLDIVNNKAVVKLTSGQKKAFLPITLLPPAPRKAADAVVPPEEETAPAEPAVAPSVPEPVEVPVPEKITPPEPDKIDLGTPWYWYVFGALIGVIAIIMLLLFIFERKRRGGGLTDFGIPPPIPPHHQGNEPEHKHTEHHPHHGHKR